MKRLFGVLALLLSLSACVGVDTVYITSRTEVNTYSGTRDRNRPARHESVFSCSSPQGLHNYLDYAQSDYSCRYRDMTAARKIHWYDSYQFGRVDVYEFMVSEEGLYYYTFETARRSYRRHY